ncbi:carboxylesterase family protein, partial [Phenylobacterium sp.]|uniref:carboxylesterase family protein n=1 Tax=Phenylobacterium sp. TaxID=1871053 RepID=UPI002FE0234F
MIFKRTMAVAMAAGLLVSGSQAWGQAAPAAAQAVTAGPVVKVAQGPVRGAVADGVATFQGIPFAAPPVGELRWRPPAPPAAWSAARDATRPGQDCTQSEDCLFLNVTAPANARPGAKLPVMVWIHGGAFVIGN